MKYPEEVLTKSKKGKIEVRKFLKRGEFVEYQYMDQKTGEIEPKTKLILKSNDKEEHYFVIPLKQSGKFLLMATGGKVKGKLWDGEKAIDLW